jgi:hypothetical protein
MPTTLRGHEMLRQSWPLQAVAMAPDPYPCNVSLGLCLSQFDARFWLNSPLPAPPWQPARGSKHWVCANSRSGESGYQSSALSLGTGALSNSQLPERASFGRMAGFFRRFNDDTFYPVHEVGLTG